MNWATVPPITIDGQYFYRDGKRFIARGIVYNTYPTNKLRLVKRDSVPIPDPLNDQNLEILWKDVHILKALNINALWVDQHDPEVSHTGCMNLLAENNIYVIFGTSAQERRHTNMQASYSASSLKKFSKVIDSVAAYRNTLGVCIANHVIVGGMVGIEERTPKIWSLYSRVIQEMKRYMRYKHHDTGQRILPLCVNEGQWSNINTDTYQFLSDPDRENRAAGGRADFYCFAHYDIQDDPYEMNSRGSLIAYPDDRVPPVTFSTSDLDPGAEAEAETPTWAETIPIRKFIEALDPIPALVSAYGSIKDRPRRWDEVRQLYGLSRVGLLSETLSGGFAYEFLERGGLYGLVGHSLEGGRRILADTVNFRDTVRLFTPSDERLKEDEELYMEHGTIIE